MEESLEVFKNREDVVMRDVVSGQGGDELTVELDDLTGLLQPSWFYDSVMARPCNVSDQVNSLVQ